MDVRGALTSCVLLVLGVILGVSVNYSGLLFDAALRLRLPVIAATARFRGVGTAARALAPAMLKPRGRE